MGSDGAGCTDFGVSRQGELTNILPRARLIRLQNKALATEPALAKHPAGLKRQFTVLNLKNHKAVSQSSSQDRIGRLARADSSWMIVF